MLLLVTPTRDIISLSLVAVLTENLSGVGIMSERQSKYVKHPPPSIFKSLLITHEYELSKQIPITLDSVSAQPIKSSLVISAPDSGKGAGGCIPSLNKYNRV